MVVVSAERYHEDVRVVRACVGDDAACRRVYRGDVLSPELDARHGDGVVRDLDLLGRLPPVEHLELRETERKALVVIDEGDGQPLGQRGRQPRGQLQPAESGAEDDDVLVVGHRHVGSQG